MHQPMLFNNRIKRSHRIKGSGHFRAKIYSKPEAPVMRQHTAKKQSIFHTELHASWSMKVLKIDMPYVSRQWRDLSWPPLLLVWAGSWVQKDSLSVPQAVVFLSRGSVFWASMTYARDSNLWKSQTDFFAER